MKGQGAMPRATFWILHQAYMLGYAGQDVPRVIRRMIGGSLIHRAWILGRGGYFEENGVSYGLARPYAESLDRDEKA